MATELDYESGMQYLPEGVFKISPSSFNTFLHYPYEWYKVFVKGEEGFTGNTASVIGTIVHYAAEKVAKGETPRASEVVEYINSFDNSEDVDASIVHNVYPVMANTLIETYVSKNSYSHVEEFLSYDLGDNVWLGGSIDAIHNGDILVDYKTFNSKSKPKSIPIHYKYQLLIYVFLARKNGINITQIRLCYINRPIIGGISEKTGKPLKNYPSEVTVLTEVVSEEEVEGIERLLMMCKDTYLMGLRNPEMVDLLYRDSRLKI